MDRSDLYELATQGDTPTGQLSPHPWISAPETKALFAALQADGAEARFVGGCVRDGLANRSITDVDVATTTPPEETVSLLERAGIKAVPTGIDHGTITAVVDNQTYEVTTLRQDVATDGRHATVAYTTNWFSDAKRRDFTINAMSATQAGEVYDPYNGISDLSYGRVRFIGNPADRIAEDHLRILRFFRFHATHGKPPIDRASMMACRLAADKITTLSAERVRAEMMKIFATLGLVDTILLMRGETVLEKVLPEAIEVGRLRSLGWLTTRAIQLDSVTYDPLRNLAALLPIEGEGAVGAQVADRWKMSGREKKRLTVMTTPLDIEPTVSGQTIEKYLYAQGNETTRDQALLAWAGEVSQEGRLPAHRTAAWISLLETTEDWERPVLPLTGQDVIDLGISSGPEVGEILRAVEQWWINNAFPSDKERCIDIARTLLP